MCLIEAMLLIIWRQPLSGGLAKCLTSSKGGKYRSSLFHVVTYVMASTMVPCRSVLLRKQRRHYRPFLFSVVISSLRGRECIFIYITKVCEINLAEAGLFYRLVSFLEEPKINPMGIRAVIWGADFCLHIVKSREE